MPRLLRPEDYVTYAQDEFVHVKDTQMSQVRCGRSLTGSHRPVSGKRYKCCSRCFSPVKDGHYTAP